MRPCAIAAGVICIAAVALVITLEVRCITSGTVLASPIRTWLFATAILLAITSAALWVLAYVVRLIDDVRCLTIAGRGADELLAIRDRIRQQRH
jgi:hypothetical protein